jgi:hypothetical protein
MQTAASLRSRFFANRLRAAFWIAAALLTVALVAAVIVGFRPRHQSSEPTRRQAVGAYITQVGRVQVRMASPVRALNAAYRGFAKRPAQLEHDLPRFRRAERTLMLLRDRIAQVKAPREARAWRSLLLELADANVATAGVVTGLAVYLPRSARAQRPLQAALAALRSDVRAARSAKAQGRAFTAYAATVSAVAQTVAGIPAPGSFTRARSAQVAHLHRLAAIASGIGNALDRKDVKKASRLVAELRTAQLSTAAARAQRASVQAFNARLAHIGTLVKRIDRERRRLEKTVIS